MPTAWSRIAAVRRHVIEEGMESVDATGRGANADDGELPGTHGACPKL
jgi:hypothetical protein